MTGRLYYHDAYLREFSARVVDTSDNGHRVYLDRTAFYPTSGGQPFDTGTLGGATVIDVIDEHDRIAHILDAPLSLGEITGQLDWPRRFDHMQQHSGQHLLSAVLHQLFDIPTLSFHLGAETCTIDVGAPALTPAQIERAEQRCAEVVAAAHPLAITFEDAAADLGLRKESQRAGELRIVTICGVNRGDVVHGDVDRSACGGTHVRTTSEIGAILLRKTEKLRGNTRLEFVCGGRALRHAREDFRLLQELSRQLSVPAAETPQVVAANLERLKLADKTAQRLAAELAQREGRELWAATAAGPHGLRRVTWESLEGPMDEAMRVRAQAFVAQGKAVFLGLCQQPPSLLLAASPDSGVHAGDRVKAEVAAAGGRGGGNAALAQASLPTASALHAVAARLA